MTSLKEVQSKELQHPKQGRVFRSKKKKIGLDGTNIRSAKFALIPVFVLLFLFLGLPVINSIQLSFSRWGGLGPLEPVGWQNYTDLVADEQMRYSARITILYAFSVAIGVVAIATILAAAVSAGVRGPKFYKGVWFFPGFSYWEINLYNLPIHDASEK